MKLNLRVGL